MCYKEAIYQSVQSFTQVKVSQDVGIELEATKRMDMGPWAIWKSKRGVCTTKTLVATTVHM